MTVRARVLRCLAGIVIVGVVAVPAEASHYFLRDLDFLSPVASEAFERFGYDDTEELLHNLVTPESRRAIHDSTGIPHDELVELARICELLQVDGIGPRAARLLLASGVSNVEDLASRHADELLAAVQAENAVGQWTRVDPHLEVVDAWVRGANRVTYIVQF